ncbi:trypsin-like peptidase domain-containing protein [Methylobacterium oryzihabitans]|uniref:trypsin-like peptidase domain-containing protein n=1 Tax=Methylobacterium oryzihabitans TaxID=2499852 RepID=UPI001FE9349D|nr:trypsin-like peptidase domain-containing protein [Methylobacterium oryzihabitans]
MAIPCELKSEEKLLEYLAISTKELKFVWWYRERMYRKFELGSKKGKVRAIAAPNNRLKYIQRRIAVLLNQIYRVRNPVHGFVKEKSVKTNALSHLKKKYIVNIDLKDFFPSITENRVIGVLNSLGIERSVSQIIAKFCCCNGHLPQGAPTSPVISNMICFKMDKSLMSMAKEMRLIYTRYADDITFSGYRPMTVLFEGAAPFPGRFDPNQLASELRQIISGNGFVLNANKAHYADPNMRRMVTGLKINEIINVDRRYIRNIRSALYSVQTIGETAAQDKYQIKYGGRSSLGAHLEGKITWLRYIRGQSDPVFRAIAVRYNLCFPNRRKIEVIPTPEEVRDRAVWVVEHSEGDMAQGSAFFLKGVGLVTAAHCVEEATGLQQISLYHPSKPNNLFAATVVGIDKHRDIAILEHSIPLTEFFELESSFRVVQVGDNMTAVGFPGFAKGDRLNVREGKISSLPAKSGVRLVEVTQKLTQGMSGGPLLDSDNKVVGIIHRGGPGEGRDFATHIGVLNDWLRERPEGVSKKIEEVRG